nr:hypothetical protein Iba_chr10bCG3360 [Ipomoea batatas]
MLSGYNQRRRFGDIACDKNIVRHCKVEYGSGRTSNPQESSQLTEQPREKRKQAIQTQTITHHLSMGHEVSRYVWIVVIRQIREQEQLERKTPSETHQPEVEALVHTPVTKISGGKAGANWVPKEQRRNILCEKFTGSSSDDSTAMPATSKSRTRVPGALAYSRSHPFEPVGLADICVHACPPLAALANPAFAFAQCRELERYLCPLATRGSQAVTPVVQPSQGATVRRAAPLTDIPRDYYSGA